MNKVLLTAALLLGSTAAIAQPGPGPHAGHGGQAAHAGHGAEAGARIQTREGAVERVRTMFARVDANRDGAITEEEAASLRARAMSERRARAADPSRRARAFEQLDLNRDNMISREEWAQAQAKRSQRQAARAARQGDRVAMRGQMHGRMGGAMLRAADANRDSRVTLQEAEAAALQRFDRADLNRDGQITPAERQQLRQQWQQRRGQTRG